MSKAGTQPSALRKRLLAGPTPRGVGSDPGEMSTLSRNVSDIIARAMITASVSANAQSDRSEVRG
jgi:hypothetical protein